MERHNVALLMLAVVIAAAFPVLYQTHAHAGEKVVLVQYSYRVPPTTEISPEPTELMMHSGSWSIESEAGLPDVSVLESADTDELTEPTKTETETDPEPVSKLKESEPTPTAKTQPVPDTHVAPPANVPEPTIKNTPETNTITAAPETQSTKKITTADTFVEALITALHRLTNQERSKVGLSVLAYDADLGAIARSHSADMYDGDYLSHTAPDGCDMTCRFEKGNYDAQTWGENIIWIEATRLPDVDELAKTFMESWMESADHRGNILSEEYTHEGIGVTHEDGAVYVTANFALPSS